MNRTLEFPAVFEIFAITHPNIMTNAHSSKQHGLSSVKQTQPKSKMRLRRNKAKAALRREERRVITNS